MNGKLIHKNIPFEMMIWKSCMQPAFRIWIRSEGAVKYFSGISSYLIFKLSVEGKKKIKFNEIWHRMNRVKGGSFNSKGKTGIFLTVQTWQLWITSWMHFFIWRADIGIYCCSGLSSKTATKLQKKKKDDKF